MSYFKKLPRRYRYNGGKVKQYRRKGNGTAYVNSYDDERYYRFKGGKVKQYRRKGNGPPRYDSDYNPDDDDIEPYTGKKRKTNSSEIGDPIFEQNPTTAEFRRTTAGKYMSP